MTTPLLQTSRLLPALASGLLACLLAAPDARAQGTLGVDPYQPYQTYGNGMPPGPVENFQSVNAARSRSYSARANEMTQFYDELNGAGNGPSGSPDTARRVPLPGVSYNAANRRFDQQFGRVYTPNSTTDGRDADADFYKAQKKRDQDYFKALKEQDPKKRAELLRAVELENLRASRAMANTNRRPVTASRAGRTTVRIPTPNAGAPATRTPAAGNTPARGSARQPGSLGTSAPGTTSPSRNSRFGDIAPPPPGGSALSPAPATGRSAPSGSARSSSGRTSVTIPRLTGPTVAPLLPARPRTSEKPSQILDRALRGTNPSQPGDEEPAIDPIFPNRIDRPGGAGAGAANPLVPPR
ncbi:MAG TPA: hypothetical protein VGZ22_07190 [Isosphaeraceae bacterium]|jgi:hypothetical protein|nr:hypothetical protein [Isosphaeraceae bacterium]